jgi:hypothetical protein
MRDVRARAEVGSFGSAAGTKVTRIHSANTKTPFLALRHMEFTAFDGSLAS